MKLQCPTCSVRIPARGVSFEQGWAKCEECDEVFPLADALPGFSSGTATAGPIERPYDARAVIERSPHELIVFVPAEGMRAGTWGLLLFITFWLGFVAFWTAGVFFGGGGPAVAFSIPFWLGGFVMLGGVLWLARGTRGVRIDSYEMVTRKKCLAWSKTRRVPFESIQHARPYQALSTSEPGKKNLFEVNSGVEIVYERGSFVLATDSDAERQWLIHEINDYLRSVAA